MCIMKPTPDIEMTRSHRTHKEASGAAARSAMSNFEFDDAADFHYDLQSQVGFVIRRAHQRHIAIFTSHIGNLTPPQFAALSMLESHGERPQSQLGAMTSMDAATIKGVVDRLHDQGLVSIVEDPADRRQKIIGITDKGLKTIGELLPIAATVTAETLKGLTKREVATLLRLLTKLS